MGYLVEPSGRLHLPPAEEAAATAAVKAAMAVRSGWYSDTDSRPRDTLADVAWAATAAITRDGDWIEFQQDDGGDSKWSNQAIAFYVALAAYVRSGRVDFEGEDGERWSYRYDAGQITMHGWHSSDDGAAEPFSEPVELPPVRVR